MKGIRLFVGLFSNVVLNVVLEIFLYKCILILDKYLVIFGNYKDKLGDDVVEGFWYLKIVL